jgi:hypothetical protein
MWSWTKMMYYECVGVTVSPLACKAMLALLTTVHEQPLSQQHRRSRCAGAVHCAAVQQDAHKAEVRL